MKCLRFLAVLGACFALSLPIAAVGQDKNKDKDDKGIDPDFKCRIIYVPTEEQVVEKMLDMVKVKKDDLVYDLGCGDGRIVCLANKKYGAKGVGVDIDPARIKDCM